MDVVILGASDNRRRYANRAQHKLVEHGHRVIPVNPNLKEVEGVTTISLDEVPDRVDTVTVYLGRDRLLPLVPALAASAPRRVILNPGADDPEVVQALESEGLNVQRACTLVLLDADRFDMVP